MNIVPISKKKIEARLADINKCFFELKRFQKMTKEDFLSSSDNFAIAEHYLRRILESIFDIGNHIISRLPIGQKERPSSYKGIAKILGDYKIVPKEYAEGKLQEMAGYRHRLVHFYHEVFPEELFNVIQKDLNDIEDYCHFIVCLLKEPKKYGLHLE